MVKFGFETRPNSFHRSNAVKAFLRRHTDQIQEVLHGFDRVRLRETLRWLQTEGSVASWQTNIGTMVTEFIQLVDGGDTDSSRGRSGMRKRPGDRCNSWPGSSATKTWCRKFVTRGAWPRTD